MQHALPIREFAAQITGAPTGRPRLVAVDGRAGAGKSQLARQLAAALPGAVVLQVDGFLWWGDLHGWWPRFEQVALRPLAAGQPARFRVRDWRGDPLGRRLGAWLDIPAADVVIVDGVSCSRRSVADLYTARIWVDSPPATCLARGLARDGEPARTRWLDWQRREDDFLRHDPIPDRAGHLVVGDPQIDHDPARDIVLFEHPARPAATGRRAPSHPTAVQHPGSHGEFPDWQPAPNIRDYPALYELENDAFDPDDLVWSAMERAAPWAGRRLLDLGCGTGFWLPRYAEEGADVIGVEPDPALRELAADRVADLSNVQILAGSAEHLPLADRSVDVVHARFAYFFGPGADAGLVEVRRVLAPGGALIAIDNDPNRGEFAELLHAASGAFARRDPATVEGWWRQRGADRIDVMAQWCFRSRDDLEAVLRNEFRDGAAETWLARHPTRTAISYGYTLYVVRAPAQR
ncbi:MAG: methyltransferase domain-containing protein [Mycobacteriales bacterium]